MYYFRERRQKSYLRGKRQEWRKSMLCEGEKKKHYRHNLCLSFHLPQGCFLFKFEGVVLCLGRFVLNKHSSLQRRALCQMALRRIALPLCSSSPKAHALLKTQILMEVNMESRRKGTSGQLHSSPDHSPPWRYNSKRGHMLWARCPEWLLEEP